MNKILWLNILLVFLFSCTNKSLLRQQELNKLSKADFPAQISMIKKSKNYTSDEKFLKYFDQGILFHYNQQFDSSLYYLQSAEKVSEDLYAKSLTNEAASLLVNDNIRPYRPKSYEETMLYNFTAMNYLALGKIDEALVESRKGTLFLDKLANDNPKKYSSDGFFNYWSAMAYENQNERDNAQISLYHALNGYRKNQKHLPPEISAYAYHEFKKSDRVNDINEFGLTNSNSQFTEKAEQIDDAEKEIIIICYGGLTPALDELKFWGTYVQDGLLVVYHNDPVKGKVSETMPAPIIASSSNHSAKDKKKFSGRTTHISFALPQKRPSKSKTDRFTAEYNGKTYQSEVVADLDALLDQNLSDERSSILLRTVIRVATRTIAAEKTKDELKSNDGFANLLINLGIDIFTDQLEMADLRSALYLPKTIQMIRIPYQNVNSLDLKAVSPSGVVLKNDQIHINGDSANKKLFYLFNSVL